MKIETGGFPVLLTLVFITLKLTNYIDWSWWWVLSPIWIVWGIALLLFAIAGMIFGITLTKKN